MNTALTSTDFAAISPLLILVAAALIFLLLESFAETLTKKIASPLAVLIFTITIVFTLYSPPSKNPLLTPWLRFDALSRYFSVLFLITGIAITLISWSYFKNFKTTCGEYYFLLMASIFGLILVGSSADFLTLFIGIETLSIALYVLCGYIKQWRISHEAAVKYFLVGSFATALLLYGIALIYGAIGTTEITLLGDKWRALTQPKDHTLFLFGIALVTLGLAFKATIVPMHAWAPDVYDGSPTPVTALMAVGTKIGAFAALTRIFLEALPNFDPIWNKGISALIYATLIYANIVALRQSQLRRFFAYSGMSHAGLMLIPFAAQNAESLPALLFYLAIYALATLGAFGVLTLLDKSSEGTNIRNLHGLFRRAPFLAGCLTLCLLTLAGIPPTAGFFAKFYVFMVAYQSGDYGLIIVGLLTSIFSAFYYLRFIGVMFSEEPKEGAGPIISWPTTIVAAACTAGIIGFSFLPAALLYK